MKIHLIGYIAVHDQGPAREPEYEKGVARVPSERNRPSWAECSRAVPGFIRGSYLGVEGE